MLELRDVHTYYGDVPVLNGVSLEANAGSVVALLGRNGMGKTTTIRSIIGFTPLSSGAIRFLGKNIEGLSPHRIARCGIGLVPQGRMIFPSLSVEENLNIGKRHQKEADAWNLERIYDMFPILKVRRYIKGHLLSGGEQQMLTIGRALMTNPKLLLLDEPSEGLAPLIVQEIGCIIQKLKYSGLSILLVEQNITMALRLADKVYILSKGRVAHQCTAEELQKDTKIQERLLSV